MQIPVIARGNKSPPRRPIRAAIAARAKLPEAALRELSCEVAEEAETAARADWLWKGGHAKLIADREVGNRPGRLEPRVLKRRHGYKLMRKPREKLRAELRKHCT